MQDLGHFKLGSEDGAAPGVKICQFTDIHHWPTGVKEFAARGRVIDFDKEGYSSERNVELIDTICTKCRPDLVIFTGDILDGRPFAKMSEDSFKAAFSELTAPLLSKNIPWLFTPGNHDDDESPWTRDDLVGIFSLPGCLISDRNISNFNLTLSIGPTEEPNEKSSTRLWLFDTGGNNPDPKIMYDTISDEVVDSYKRLSKSDSLSPTALGLAYFHIPLPEYAGLDPVIGLNGLFDAALHGGKVPFPFNYQPFTGLVRLLGKDRVVGCSKLNSDIFNAMKEEKNILATFCGHDHHSDAVFKRDGIYLCYGRVSGNTPPIDWEGTGGDLNFQRGGRFVHISLQGKATTWVETLDASNEDKLDFENTLN